MYVEQETYSTNGEGNVLEMILMQTIIEGAVRIIGISNSQLQFHIFILTIKFGISIVQIPYATIINLDPIVVVLFFPFFYVRHDHRSA